MSEDTTQEETAEVGGENQNQNQAELTVQDLAAIKQIIDLASQRGAFRPNEMVAVGQTYSKLETFLNAVSSSQGEAQ